MQHFFILLRRNDGSFLNSSAFLNKWQRLFDDCDLRVLRRYILRENEGNECEYGYAYELEGERMDFNYLINYINFEESERWNVYFREMIKYDGVYRF